LVQTAVIWNSGSALKAGMWASPPQPWRTFAPMIPTRSFSLAMMIFILSYESDMEGPQLPYDYELRA
ncbi:MAG: hypothetical protein WBE69_06620, partial [Candidatus Binataceae bacterium]